MVRVADGGAEVIDPAERQQWADIYAQEPFTIAQPATPQEAWRVLKWAHSMAAIAEQHAPNDDDDTMEVDA